MRGRRGEREAVMEIRQIVEVVRAHLSPVIGASAFDAGIDETGEGEIAADAWTMTLLASGGGFLAADDEPDHAAAYPEAIHKLFPDKVLRALAAADGELGGALTARLAELADPLTLAFVAAVRESAPPDDAAV
jgi:hypothetical protein